MPIQVCHGRTTIGLRAGKEFLSNNSQQIMRESKAGLKDHDSFCHVKLSSKGNKLSKTSKNFSEIRIKRNIDRKKKSEVKYQTNVIKERGHRELEGRSSSKRAKLETTKFSEGAFLEIKNTRRTSKLTTNANSIFRNAARSSNNGDILVIERLLSDLRARIEEQDESSRSSSQSVKPNTDLSMLWDTKITIISKSLKEYRTEFPVFTNYISYIKDLFNHWVSEFSEERENTNKSYSKTLDELQQNLQSENLQNEKTTQKLSKAETLIKDLQVSLDQEKAKQNDFWVKKWVFSRLQNKIFKQEISTQNSKITSLNLLLQKSESENEKLKLDQDIFMKKFKEAEGKMKEFIERLDLESYDLRSDDFRSESFPASPPNLPKTPSNIPKLDIQKVLEVKEKAEREDSSLEEEEEEDEEQSLLTENEIHMFIGSKQESADSLTRKGSLLRRKEEVIDLLNKWYENEDPKDQKFHPQAEESKRIWDSESFVPSQSSGSIKKEFSKKLDFEDGEVQIYSRNSESKSPISQTKT